MAWFNFWKTSKRAITATNSHNFGLYVDSTAAGICVSEQTALALSCLWRAARVVSESVGTMPLKLYSRGSAGREEAREHPLWSLLHDEPNPDQSAYDFWQLLLCWSVIWGNGYAEIVRQGDGVVSSLYPIPPWSVQPDRDTQGNLYYRVGPDLILDPPDILHLKGPSADGSQGYRLCQVARDSLANALAVDRFAGSAFANNLKLGGTINHPGALSDNARENLRASWKRDYGGYANAGKWILLEEGMTAVPFQINIEQAQLVPVQQQQIYEVCRWIGVDPIFVYEYGRATWNNAEAQTRNFLQFSLNPKLVQAEGELNRKVVRDPELYAEFVRESIIQMDAKTQAEVWQIGVNAGWYEVNEVRAWLNLPPTTEPEPQPVEETVNANPTE